jgi:hypothetical protein
MDLCSLSSFTYNKSMPTYAACRYVGINAAIITRKNIEVYIYLSGIFCKNNFIAEIKSSAFFSAADA